MVFATDVESAVFFKKLLNFYGKKTVDRVSKDVRV